MNVKELIKELKKLPEDLPIRVLNPQENVKAFENEWVYGLEFSETGDSGYEHCGEVRLLISE